MRIRSLPEYPTAAVFSYSTLVQNQNTRVAQDVALARELGITLSEQDVLPHMGKPAHEFYPAVFGRETGWESLRDGFLRLGGAFPRPLYPEALGLLQTLRQRGVQVGIVGLCSEVTVADEISRHAGMSFADFVDLADGKVWLAEDIEDDEAGDRPHEALLIRALASPALKDAVVVGDEKGWLTAAEALEAPAIGVPSSLATAADLDSWRVPVIAGDLPEVQHLLLGRPPVD